MSKSKNKAGLMFITASVVGFLIFMVYPLAASLKLVFTSSQGNVVSFVGLNNFKRILSDKMFWNAMKNTLIFFVFQVPPKILLAIILAVMLNDSNLKFKKWFRLAIFLPAVTSLVSYSVLFKMMFSSQGIINNLLMNTLGLISNPIPWLEHSVWSKVVIVIAMIWRWTGYNMLFFLSALQNIPSSHYEAAEIDGANKFKQFIHITLPQLMPMILFTTVMSTMGSLQLFDEPMNITAGGPAGATTTIAMYIYNVSFKYLPNFGYAAALSYVVMLIVATLSFLQFKFAEGDKND